MERTEEYSVLTDESWAVSYQPVLKPINFEPLPAPVFRDYSAKPTITRGIFPDVESSFHLVERLSDGRWLCAREDGYVEIRHQEKGTVLQLIEGSIIEGQKNPAPITIIKEYKDYVIMADTFNIIRVWQKKPQFIPLVSFTAKSIITDIIVYQNQIVCLSDGGKLILLNPTDIRGKTINLETCQIAGLCVTPENTLAVIKKPANDKYQLYLVQHVDETTAILNAAGPCIRCPVIHPILRLSYNQNTKSLTFILLKAGTNSAYVFGVAEIKPSKEGSKNYLTNYYDFEPTYQTKSEAVLDRRNLACSVTREGHILMIEKVKKFQQFHKPIDLSFDYCEFPTLQVTPQKDSDDDLDIQPFFSLRK